MDAVSSPTRDNEIFYKDFIYFYLIFQLGLARADICAIYGRELPQQCKQILRPR
jgi:hypothetical protein